MIEHEWKYSSDKSRRLCLHGDCKKHNQMTPPRPPEGKPLCACGSPIIHSKHENNAINKAIENMEGKHPRADREHSPLPWVLQHHVIKDTQGKYVVDGADCNAAFSDLEFIVTAVNLHAKLAAALEAHHMCSGKRADNCRTCALLQEAKGDAR